MKKWISLICFLIIITLSMQPIQAIEKDLEVHSQYVYLYDQDTALTYIDKRADEKMYPASMTKILTVSLALDKITNIKERVTITKEDLNGLLTQGASVAGFYEGEKVTYEDLLYGALLPSGADACNALARLTYGSVKNMVQAMNDRFVSLQLKNSHFKNVTGLHDDNHYTSAKDMAMIVIDSLKDSNFKKIFETNKYTDSSGKREWLSSLERAKHLKNIDISHINGGKSGYTDAAQLTLASTLTYNNHDFVLVTGYAKGQRSQNHVNDANTVYKYLSDNFNKLTIYKKDEDIHTYFLLKSFYGFETLSSSKDISLIVSKDIPLKDIQVSYEGKTIVETPLKPKEKLGTIKVSHKEKDLYTFHVSFDEKKESSIFAIMIHYGIIVLFVLLLSRLVYKLFKKRTHMR